MTKILTLMTRLEALKRTARTGWNMQFPAGHALKTRCVPDAESVADHSWSLAMMAFLIAKKLNLDVEKIVTMALVHDVAECITLDIVIAILEPEEQVRVKKEKRDLEDRAMRELFFPLGALGEHCYSLWLEYENQSCEEARILKQLDKLEASLQAVQYSKQGHQLDPNEFIDYTQPFLTHPDLVALLNELRSPS